jgi:hypothetical protein
MNSLLNIMRYKLGLKKKDFKATLIEESTKPSNLL